MATHTDFFSITRYLNKKILLLNWAACKGLYNPLLHYLLSLIIIPVQHGPLCIPELRHQYFVAGAWQVLEMAKLVPKLP